MLDDALKPAKILVVDDMATNREIAKAALGINDYDVDEAENGQVALEKITNNHYDAVLLDILMPEIDGLEVCKRLRAIDQFKLLPVIMLTSLENPEDVVLGMDAGASDYINKPYSPEELKARIDGSIRQKRLTDRLDDIESVLFTLARMVEARDTTTGDHCSRLSHMGVVFGKKLQLTNSEIEALRRGGILHDIGKLGIPDHILLKKGKLTDDEWKIMRQHVVLGANLCQPLRTMQDTVNIVQYHHEAWDGSGYPNGLYGDKIPVLARVFQVLDIYDALVSIRPYKPAFTLDKVVSILQEESLKNLRDPRLINDFIKLIQLEPEVLKKPPGEEVSSRSIEITKEFISMGFMDWYNQNPLSLKH